MTINAKSRMEEVLEAFPGEQRALFRRYHIGGCSSCGFQPTETLEQLCGRHNNLNVAEVIQHISSSHATNPKMLLSPPALLKLREENPSFGLLYVVTPQEYETVH